MVPRVVDFPKCHTADIELHVRMPTYSPLVDPKFEMLLQLCREEDATLEPIFPITDNWIQH